MSMPSERDLKKIREELNSSDAMYILDEDASTVDRLKFELCKKIVRYLRVNEITQHELSQLLGVDPARISEIVNYKIFLFSADKLIELVSIIDPKLKISVA